MGSSTAYQLKTGDSVLAHSSSVQLFLHDMFEDAEDPDTKADALAVSGDCFATLATSLTDTVEQLVEHPEAAYPRLKELISTLLYLQRHYDVVRKPEDRQ